MKLSTPETITFHPIMQVFDAGEAWGVGFDSASPRDAKRQSRVVFVQKKGIKQLAVKVDGFSFVADPAHVEETSDEWRARLAAKRAWRFRRAARPSVMEPAKSFDPPHIDGSLFLVATYDNDSVVTHLLAECSLSPWAHHLDCIPFSTIHDVAKAVRSGMDDALTAVLPDMCSYGGEERPPSLRRIQTIRRERGRSSGHSASHANRLQRWKPWFAVGGVVAVVWVLLSIIGRPAHSPEQAALAASGPNVSALQLPQATGADAQAQVELVKSTLKSMGLDPGASGDTGCLVQPQ